MSSLPIEKYTEMQEILENRTTSPKIHSEWNTVVILSLLQSNIQKGKNYVKKAGKRATPNT